MGSSVAKNSPEFIAEMVESFMYLLDNNEQVRMLIADRIRTKFPKLLGASTQHISKAVNTIKTLLNTIDLDKDGNNHAELLDRLHSQMDETDQVLHTYFPKQRQCDESKIKDFRKDLIKAKSLVQKKPVKRNKFVTEDGEIISKPASSFMIYCNENRPKLMEEHADYPMVEIAKLLSKQWNDLGFDEKQVFNDKFKQAKTEYEEKIAKFKQDSQNTNE
jgi:LPS O-antigen subunit length determinant protein (WzzB/FepE family)